MRPVRVWNLGRKYTSMSLAEIFLPAQSGYSRATQCRNSRAKSWLVHSRYPRPVATMAASPSVRMVSGIKSRTISGAKSRMVSGTVSGANWRDVLGGGDGSVAWDVAAGVATGAASVDFTSGTTVDCTGVGSDEPRFHQRDVGSLVTAMRVGFRFGEIQRSTATDDRGASRRLQTRHGVRQRPVNPPALSSRRCPEPHPASPGLPCSEARSPAIGAFSLNIRLL